MPRNNDFSQFIVPAQDAYLYQLIYDRVYGSNSGCTIVINGTTVQIGAKSSIDILVRSVSGGTGCLLAGDRPYAFGEGSQYKYVPQTFVSVWDTSKTSAGSSTSTQVKLPLISTGTYNFIVDWGDGSTDKITTWNQAQTTHTYASTGIYQLTITGTIQGFRFNNTGDRLKLLSIFKWGVGFRLGATDAHFYGCANLDLSEVEDILDLSGTTTINSSFRACTRLSVVNRMNEWDISKNTTLDSTFYDSPNFNTNIGDWDTSNVTNMSSTFYQTTALASFGKFNQDISKWNTSKVTNMLAMFWNQPYFNHDISTKVVTNKNGVSYIAWDVSKVTDTSGILGIAITNSRGVFNQNIGNWDTSKVTNMNTMFQNQVEFNQDISTKVVTVSGSSYIAWDTSNVTNMNFMFGGTAINGKFNGNITNWNISKVTSIQAMFANKPNFNQDISTKVVTVSGSSYIAWDTSNVTNMSLLFNNIISDSVFNQNIGNWNTSKVTNMNQLFTGLPDFNQNISTKVVTISGSSYSAWSVSNVTTMNYMFYTYGSTNNRKAGSFNNSGSTAINNWDVRKVTSMTDMFNYQTGFNQPINNWVITGVTSFNLTGNTSGFMFGKTSNDYSSANYDALLISWASRSVKPNLKLDFGTIKYSSAATSARTTLTSAPNNWTIIDGGLI